MEEKRFHHRYDCYFIVQYKKHSYEDDFFGEVYNMSSGGAMIECDHEVRKGQILSLAFIMDDRQQIWEGKGRIVWVIENDGRSRFGLEFTQPLEENWHERYNT